MKEQRQIEELAKIEGCTHVACGGNGHPWGYGKEQNPIPCDYLNSHDAIMRLIDGLSYEQSIEYHRALRKICDSVELFIKATPEQKAEAVLRAYGKWEERNMEEEFEELAEGLVQTWNESDCEGSAGLVIRIVEALELAFDSGRTAERVQMLRGNGQSPTGALNG